MTINEAIAKRVLFLLSKEHITQYRLEQEAGLRMEQWIEY